MSRLVLGVDPELGIDGASLVAAWQKDESATLIGNATVSQSAPEAFVPGLVELVAIPLAVNIASNVLYDVVTRVVGSLRRRIGDDRALDLVEPRATAATASSSFACDREPNQRHRALPAGRRVL